MSLNSESEHTCAELAETIDRMQMVSNNFYAGAAATGCHTFIEFCGLMNEYIKVCRQSLAAGIDFTETSVHGSGKALLMHDFNALYLAEKFACIFETSLRDPRIKQIFFDAIERKGG